MKTILSALLVSAAAFSFAAPASAFGDTEYNIDVDVIVEAPAAPGSDGRVADALANNNGNIFVGGIAGMGDVDNAGKVSASVQGVGASANVDLSYESVNAGDLNCNCVTPSFDASAIANSTGGVTVIGGAGIVGSVSETAIASATVAGIGASASISAGNSAINK